MGGHTEVPGEGLGHGVSLFDGVYPETTDECRLAEVNGDAGYLGAERCTDVGQALFPRGGIHDVGGDTIHQVAILPRGGTIRIRLGKAVDALPQGYVTALAECEHLGKLENVIVVDRPLVEPADLDPDAAEFGL